MVKRKGYHVCSRLGLMASHFDLDGLKREARVPEVRTSSILSVPYRYAQMR